MSDGLVRIYVDLDSLFDTRLATLHLLDPEKTLPLLRESYFKRDYDEFEGYDTEQYKNAWKTRDQETIRNSVVTDVPRLILFFAEKTLRARSSTPLVAQPLLHLNIHPYKLPESAINSIIHGVKLLTKGLIDIEVIDTPISQLTPKHIKERYTTMVMYEYWEWLEYHAQQKNFDNVFCPEITLIGPAIVRSKEAWEEVKVIDIYKVIEQYSSMFIKLTLYPVTTFSVNIERMVRKDVT